MRNLNLKPEYSSSHALIIGIDVYEHVSPLHHATSDAKAVAEILHRVYSFPQENIITLLDREATRTEIVSAYFCFDSKVDTDSRLMVFFAGHGYTKTGAHREVGFLFPHDGRIDNLATLIRWEDFTLNAELIPAKHVFFVMDACYGGLVFNRAVSAGSVRFLKDMLIRPVRQALTAGKQDEPVADGGGPLPDHSIFTGHLLNGLDGAARAPEGHLTASSLMSYVYRQVANDIRSSQTPAYGFLTGDGDFVFDAPMLSTMAASETAEQDVLITISSLDVPEEQGPSSDPFVVTKQYLSDPKSTIQLHDFVMHHVRKVIIETPKERFPVEGVDFSVEELLKRLQLCETATHELRRMLACIAYWGGEVHREILSKSFARVTDHIEPENGLIIWNGLRWYPSILLLYASGISSIANNRYENLAAIFSVKVSSPRVSSEYTELSPAIVSAIAELKRCDAFKQLPGHEKYYVPMSEYLFKLLQLELDDDLFLGKEYEFIFDCFEVLLALSNATNRKKNGHSIWGPVGRFGWKHGHGIGRVNPLSDIIKQAKDEGQKWSPFRAGLFGSDYELFMSATDEYGKMIAGLNWF